VGSKDGVFGANEEDSSVDVFNKSVYSTWDRLQGGKGISERFHVLVGIVAPSKVLEKLGPGVA
jgi:hypothetical protein